MPEEYLGALEMKQTFILELSSKSIRQIAQALHLYSFNDGIDKTLLHETFNDLREQTNVVYTTPKEHAVYELIADAPAIATLTKNALFIPVD